MIFTSISPNAEADDIRLAAGLLVRPWKWKRGPAVAELERSFAGKFKEQAVAFQSGRNALYAILTALGLSKGDEVLMQAYTCVAVPEPVLWVGAKPVYVDVGSDLCMDPDDLARKITVRSKVLIIQHTFGAPANVSKLVETARRDGMFVIEDCAHALGTAVDGMSAGSLGDAAFFSFGRDKSVSSVFGGVAIARDAALAQKMRDVRDSFTDLSSGRIFAYLLHPVLTSLAKKTYNFFSLGKSLMALSLRAGLIPRAVEAAELSGKKPSFAGKKMPNAVALLAVHQLDKVERFAAARRHAADIYSQALPHIPHQRLDPGATPLRFTIFVENARGLILAARSKGIELGDWYDTAIAPARAKASKVGYLAGSCPNAERYARMSVNLPTHALLADKDISKIIDILRSWK